MPLSAKFVNRNRRYNFAMHRFAPLLVFILLAACAPRPAATPATRLELPTPSAPGDAHPRAFREENFAAADGTRALALPADLGAHPAYRSEWWYYTGNLDAPQRGHFGFELTIFRVSLRPPDAPRGAVSWNDGQLYFAHFAVSEIAAEAFHAFQRFARPGPGLAGAQAAPYRVWVEDWEIAETAPHTYHLFAAQGEHALDLTLNDLTGFVLHGEAGYSRKGASPSNASYYYSLPRLQARGRLQTPAGAFQVEGLAWMDHEFSTSALDAGEVGWDWFALQFSDGTGLMLYQLRQTDGSASPWSSGTFISAQGRPQPLGAQDFVIRALDTWRSPRTGGEYPSRWQVQVPSLGVDVQVEPWMQGQELDLSPAAYWEGAVRIQGTHQGNGYVELTGYAGDLPLP